MRGLLVLPYLDDAYTAARQKTGRAGQRRLMAAIGRRVPMSAALSHSKKRMVTVRIFDKSRQSDLASATVMVLGSRSGHEIIEVVCRFAE